MGRKKGDNVTEIGCFPVGFGLPEGRKIVAHMRFGA